MIPALTISKAEAMNPSRRNTMEDVHVTYSPGEWGCNDEEMSFIGVYDGHGGRDTADFLETKLHESIAEELNINDEASIQIKIERAFLMTDVECRMSGIKTSGATAAICLIKRHTNGRKITIHSANAGDARAVISCQPTSFLASSSSSSTAGAVETSYCTNSIYTNQITSHKSKRPRRQQRQNILIPKAYRLTFDHKSDDEDEITRIEDAGGFLLKNRVLGIMAIARSLGDQGMKEYVIGRPFVNTVEIDLDCTNIATSHNDNDVVDTKNNTNSITTTSTSPSTDIFQSEFVIVACDGIWDVLSDQEAVDLVRSHVNEGSLRDGGTKKYKETAAKMLCQQALDGGSTDNITVLVVWF